jgi:AcrR family transcriptional regulator
MGRDYVLKRRADRMAETRRRITDAVVYLHGTVGAARTTISAIAERAGVERLTVYRHFPDEAALLDACTSHWRARHPPPDPSRWGAIADPEVRLRAALGALYPYYRSNRDMLSNSVRDRESVPALAAQMEAFDGYLDGVRDVLTAGWTVRPARARLLAAALGHALDFRAWMSMADHGIRDRDAGELMAGLVCRAVEGTPSGALRRLRRVSRTASAPPATV